MSSSSSSLAPETVDVLFRQHAGGLQRLLRGILRDGERVEEALQQTFLKLLESGGEVGVGRHRAWLQRVAVREALALKRRQAGHEDVVQRGLRQGGIAVGLGHDSAEEEATRREALARAGRLIARLPMEQREVLAMHLREGLSFREIAERTGVTRSTALTRMRLALQKLRVLRDEDDGPRGRGPSGGSR